MKTFSLMFISHKSASALLTVQPHTELSPVESPEAKLGAVYSEHIRDLQDVSFSILGSPDTECGDSYSENDIPTCNDTASQTYAATTDSSYADVKNIDGLADADLVGSVYLLADTQGLTPCTYRGGEGRLRVIYDAMFANFPRCCPRETFLASDKLQQSMFNTVKKVNESHTAVELDGVTFDIYGDVLYSAVDPPLGSCTLESKCALVVNLPGAGQQPWLMMQAWCGDCKANLGVHVLSVDHIESTPEFVDQSFIPFLQNYTQWKKTVDIERVYLTSASMGNELALYAAFAHPLAFKAVIMAGKFIFTQEIQDAIKGATARLRSDSVLRSLEFHVGTEDPVADGLQVNSDQTFFQALNTVEKFIPGDVDLPMTLRFYPQATHYVWEAAWNTLHEMVWTGTKKLEDYSGQVPRSCVGV